MLRIISLGLLLSFSLILPALAQVTEEKFTVEVDKARIMRLPQAAAAVIVGNPAIADAAVHNGRLLLITGKIFGGTNVIALDARGNVILERDVHVSAPKLAAITYYRGGIQRSYTCAGVCEPSPTIGDEKEFFDKLIKQQQGKSDQGYAAASPE